MDCDSQRGKGLLTAVTQEKHYFFFLTCSVDSVGFFSPFCSSVVMSILLALRNPTKLLSFFFPLSYIVYLCHKTLPPSWTFAVLWSFPLFFLFSFFNFNFLNLLILSTFIPLFAFPTFFLIAVNL